MKNPQIICLIDDDEIYQFTAQKSIESTGLAQKIIAFSDGQQALDYLTQNMVNVGELPDVVFLDINMPYLDGWGFLEGFKELDGKMGKEITIYMVSSSVLEEDIAKAKTFGKVKGYVIKPITPSKFSQVITETPDSDSEFFSLAS